MARSWIAISVLALGLALGLAQSACRTTSPECQKRIDDCLARCQRTGTLENPPQRRGGAFENTTDYCHDVCHCGPEGAAKPPAQSGPPTYTGNTQ